MRERPSLEKNTTPLFPLEGLGGLKEKAPTIRKNEKDQFVRKEGEVIGEEKEAENVEEIKTPVYKKKIENNIDKTSLESRKERIKEKIGRFLADPHGLDINKHAFLMYVLDNSDNQEIANKLRFNQKSSEYGKWWGILRGVIKEYNNKK